MLIEGRYKKDDNFTTVFSGDTMYVIARNTGEWGCRRVGDTLACGGALTSDLFAKLEGECTEVGEFRFE